MPNHVFQRLVINADDETLKRIKDLVYCDEQEQFSADCVIPMPPELRETCAGSQRDIGYDIFFGNWERVAKYPWLLKDGRPSETRADLIARFQHHMIEKHGFEGGKNELETFKKEGAHADKCFRKYGHGSWYTWALQNWGTKWGIYDAKWVSGSEVTFLSAWSPPFPVLGTLSAKFTDAEFHLEYVDEMINFIGKAFFYRGDFTDREFSSESDESKMLMKNLGIEPLEQEVYDE